MSLRTHGTLLVGLALTTLSVAAAHAQQVRFDDPAVQAGLEALKDEPSIQVTQRAALEFFNIDSGTVSSMRTRARLKSLLPELSSRYRYNTTDADLDKFDLVNADRDVPVLIDDSVAEVHEVQVGGSWNLPRLVFNPEVLDVSSLAVLQEGVLKEVTRLYYTRRRLQVDLILSPPADPATRLSKELRVEELTATLDAMTGGLFSKAAARQDRLDGRRQEVRRRMMRGGGR